VLEDPPRPRRSHGRGPPPRDPRDHGRGGGGGEGGSEWESFADDAGSFALVLALIGIGTLFAVLIAVWLFLRRPAPDWNASSAGASLDALWISSALLFGSSVAIERAARVARLPERRAATLRWIVASLALGLAFVGAQAELWTTLWRAGLVPSSSGYAAVFFALTGLHALHVLGGLGFLGFLGARHRRRVAEPPAAASVRRGAIYWHFMGALWLVLFTLLYFVR
jgi:heme/copper-type cytochrome/quinol oxidase subunit 3